LGDVVDCEILAYKRPSFIKKVDYKDILDELWKRRISTIPEEDTKIKKLIANVNFGLLEKGKNTAIKTHVFETLDEAKTNQAEKGGVVNYIRKYLSEEVEEEDDDGDKEIRLKHTQEGKEYYVLNVQDTAVLRDGFRYIKELLLQEFNSKLNKDYQALIGQGVKVYSVKTDAFVIAKADVEKARTLIQFGDNMGDWRVSKTDDYLLPSDSFKLVDNTEVEIVEPTAQRVEIKDEWDTKELCKVFEDKKRVMVRAEYGGCGKSYAAAYMKKLGHKVLFVCPTNKLAINTTGVTLNKLFGFGMADNDKITKFDDSKYDVVVFDEVYFYSVCNLQKIKRYCEKNPDKIIIATGDMNQLEPIECSGNNVDADYIDTCINKIFEYDVYLQENKRLKKKADKEKLRQFKKDIFDPKMLVADVIKKYFRTTNKFTTAYNIAYQNQTCANVAKQVRTNLNKEVDYEVGELLICRNYFKVKDYRFNVNYEYEVVKVGLKEVSLRDNSTEAVFVLPKCLVEKSFIFSYCRTCHSLQGSSIEEEYTIF
jgi:hypothetical protein